MMPAAEYGRFRYENRYHYVKSMLAYAREQWEPSLQFADQCLAHAATYGARKYEVRGRLARGQALWRLEQRHEGEREIVTAAEHAGSLGFPTWARRCWVAAAGLTRSGTYRANAAAAVAEIAEHLDAELRDRFLAEVSRER